MQETSLFLEQLFGDVGSPLWFYAWTLQDKRTLWFQNSGEAESNLSAYTSRSAEKDCYIGVSLSSSDYGPKVRLKEEEGRVPAGIVGMWADIDFAHSAHKKKALPPTVRDALWLIESCGIPPTVIVNSGHGLQPWWLFKEPWVFENDKDRVRAASLAASWSQLFKRKAGAKHWSVDSVHDLTRVMRLPGTWNHKDDEPIQAVIVEADWTRRYDPCAFEGFEEQESVRVVPAYKCDDIILVPDANPDVEKLDLLKDNESDFRKLWDHRKPLPSNSEYECALARYAAEALWNDQQIANLIICHRRKWDPSKIDKVTKRRDYVEGIIALVKGDGQRSEAMRQLADDVDRIPPDATSNQEGQQQSFATGDDDQRQKDFDRISAILGVKVARWVQLGKEKPIYTMILTNGQELKIGSVAAVTDNYKAIARAIYAETGHCMEAIPRKAWPGVCSALSRVCEVVEAPESKDSEAARHGIEQYLHKIECHTIDEKNAACMDAAPFTDGELVYVVFDPLYKWLNFHGGDKWERPQLLNAMRTIGFKRKTIRYTDTRKNKESSRSYYLIALSAIGADAEHSKELVGKDNG